MQQGVHQRDWKTYARQNKGARSRHPTRADRDLRRFRACSQHRTQATREQSKVYWSWPLLLHAQSQRGNSYKTSNINRNSGIEIPAERMPTIKKHNNRRAVRQRTAEGANHWSARIKMHQSEMLKNNKSQQLVFTTVASFIQVIVSWSTVTRGEAILLLFDNLGVNVSKLTINELANIADVKSTINLNCSY